VAHHHVDTCRSIGLVHFANPLDEKLDVLDRVQCDRGRQLERGRRRGPRDRGAAESGSTARHYLHGNSTFDRSPSCR
jgi:hypothetical protein